MTCPPHILTFKNSRCGFKLFTRKAAKVAFTRLHIKRWAFDVEVLFIAQALGLPIAEVQVHWQEMDGSKVDTLTDAPQMLRDMVLIRICYGLKCCGLWRLPVRR